MNSAVESRNAIKCWLAAESEREWVTTMVPAAGVAGVYITQSTVVKLPGVRFQSAENAADSRQLALRALKGVVDMHHCMDVGFGDWKYLVCEQCSNETDWVDYPCPTMQKVESDLSVIRSHPKCNTERGTR